MIRYPIMFLMCLVLHSSVISAQDPDLVDQALAGGPMGDSAVMSLRALGQAGLDLVSAAYDRQCLTAQVFGDDARWDVVFDAVGCQRDNRASRLFWYTDLAEATKVARGSHRPILALRMLGALTDSLSCANSRFFRSILYPDPHVSAWLRDHVILYWSSERPVPQVTIDFGDGRVLQTTLGGNSVHLILDCDGNPIDALPGLYGPAPFLDHLQAACTLIATMSGMTRDARKRAFIQYHQRELDTESHFLVAHGIVQEALPDNQGDWSVEAAERVTVSKSAIEMPVLQGIGMSSPSGSSPVTGMPFTADQIDRLAANIPELGMLSDVSRSIVSNQMTDRGWQGQKGKRANMAMVFQVQANVAKDTIIDEYSLHPAIHRFLMANAGCRIDGLQRWIYARLFRTPASDPWLGMQPVTWDGISRPEVVGLVPIP